MTELRIVQVDAFADRPFTGNPAAVMPLEAWLPDETLQAIAMENNLSETAFTIPADGEADFELRWFTPTDRGRALRPCHSGQRPCPDRSGDRVRFRTRRAGMLEVARDGDGYALSLPAWKPEPKPLPRIVEALGCSRWRRSGTRIATGWSSSVREAEVLALRPDFRRLAAEGDILTIVTAPGSDADIVSRVFATGAGIDEDPVTGSAHAVLVPYWAERLGRDHLSLPGRRAAAAAASPAAWMAIASFSAADA